MRLPGLFAGGEPHPERAKAAEGAAAFRRREEWCGT
jgi:hypothetical protein